MEIQHVDSARYVDKAMELVDVLHSSEPPEHHILVRAPPCETAPVRGRRGLTGGRRPARPRRFADAAGSRAGVVRVQVFLTGEDEIVRCCQGVNQRVKQRQVRRPRPPPLGAPLRCCRFRVYAVSLNIIFREWTAVGEMTEEGLKHF